MSVPVVDFSCYNVNLNPGDVDEIDAIELSNELFAALTQTGFVYLKNHGISSDLIEHVMKTGMKFFELPQSQKDEFYREKPILHGYTKLGTETLYSGFLPDHKESYNIFAGIPKFDKEKRREFPTKYIPDFEKVTMELFKKSEELAIRFMDCLAIAMQLKDLAFFRKCHNMNGEDNSSEMRILHYPAVPQDFEFKDLQYRCVEHTDWGSITLLYQDDVGGLEVKNRQGEYIDAVPIKDTILVNVGEMMQQWTSDTLPATAHRVRLIQDDPRSFKSRVSIPYFCLPDSEFMVRCLDGSDKYQPIKFIDHVRARIAANSNSNE